MHTFIAYSIFILMLITLTLCGGFSVWFLSRKIIKTRSWLLKIGGLIIIFLQLIFVSCNFYTPLWFYFTPDSSGGDMLGWAGVYALNGTFSMTVFCITATTFFYQKIAKAPYRGLKTLAVLLLLIAISITPPVVIYLIDFR